MYEVYHLPTSFDSCIDTEIHFVFIIEINKQFRVQYKNVQILEWQKTTFAGSKFTCEANMVVPIFLNCP
jgi:hypothetical protein